MCSSAGSAHAKTELEKSRRRRPARRKDDRRPAKASSELRMTIPVPKQSIIETRREQMLPVLEPSELERVCRFGELRRYAAGEALAKVGETGHGLSIILARKVEVTRHKD